MCQEHHLDSPQFRGREADIQDTSWNIYKLRQSFDLVERELGNIELPFPPDLVAGISDEDIESLRDVFEISDDDQAYSFWRNVFYDINQRYLNNEQFNIGCEIAANLKKFVHESILAQVFFLQAYFWNLMKIMSPFSHLFNHLIYTIKYWH